MSPDDLGLVRRLDKLFVTIVSDILDDYYDGVHVNKYLMEPAIKPVFPEMKVSGMATTFSGASTAKTEVDAPPSPTTENVGNAALESIRPGHVVVYGTNHCRTAACWGELMTTIALTHGGRGVVTDGFARDLNRIRQIKPLFPVFAAGAMPTSGKGRLELREFNVPVWCGGVPVRPGDFILGDLDGVIVIPRGIAAEVIPRCEERLKTEDKARDAFRKGKRVADVFEKYKVG